jgi:AcrR family transcriptional regulator
MKVRKDKAVGNTKRNKLTEFNRGNILEAAKRLFEANGVGATTMDDIAKEADYSKSTIYVYFKSKEEIYYTLIHESMAVLQERLKTALEERKRFEEAYFAICGILADFPREHPLYFEGMAGEISVDEQDFERCPVLRDIYDTGEQTNAMMAEAVRRGMETGYLRADLKPLPAILTLWASLCGVIRTAEQKEKYFCDKLGISKREYLDYGFRMLLVTIRKSE